MRAPSSSRISEALAWDVALTWRASLQHRAALVTDSAGVESRLVKSYQWVQLDVRSAREAAHARAAVHAWFWLSCCPGFSGLENPQFWKRVFCELRGATLCEEPITDAVRFFDIPGSEFPRVQFDYLDAAVTRRAHSRSTAARSFLGVGALEDEEATATTKALGEIYRKLERHMDASRLARTIPMRVHAVDYPAVSAIHKDAASPGAPWAPPRFEILSRQRCSATWTPALSSERARRAVPNYFESLFANAPSGGTTATFKPFMRVRLERDRLAPHLIQRVCSAAPQSRAIDTLHLKTTTHRTWYDPRVSETVSERVAYPEFSRMEWAWIGFAMFHPDAATSALRHLNIGLHGITREAVEILKLMKRGNHLHTIATGSLKPTTKGYTTAELREHSVVRQTASEKGERLMEARDGQRVTLCVDDASVLPAWVRVAVPGIGLAWVQSSDIVQVSTHQRLNSHITSLRVELESASESNAALAFARVVGANLTHLDISACADVRASKLRRVLETCPRLTSLSARHDGSLWASANAPSSLPRLQELCLTLEGTVFDAPSPLARRTSLQKLSALRIRALETACFEINKSAVVELIESHAALEYFHWSGPSALEPGSFSEGLTYTREQLARLSARGRSEQQALAFLSAVRSTQGTTSALGELNSDVAATILAFAKPRTAPTYWVDVSA